MKKGLTLIELLISVTIMAILLTTFSRIYVTSMKVLREQMTQTKIQTENQTITDRILSEAKKSRTVSASYNGYNLGPEVLILDLPSINNYTDQIALYSGSNPLIDKVIYYKNGNDLIRKIFANPQSARTGEVSEKILTNNVTSLNFSYTYPPGSSNASHLSTSITLTKKVGNVTSSSSLNGYAAFRNLP